jgi:hypothetical protein
MLDYVLTSSVSEGNCLTAKGGSQCATVLTKPAAVAAVVDSGLTPSIFFPTSAQGISRAVFPEPLPL